MSRKGNPHNNELMESFYKALKRELVNGANFATIKQTQLEILKYIETYYNLKRPHSAFGYQLSKEFEKTITNLLNCMSVCLFFFFLLFHCPLYTEYINFVM